MVRNKIEDVLSWRNPVETVSAMALFSLVTINPSLLVSLPLFILVFALLVPSYQSRHPPPPTALSNAPTEVTQAISPAPQPAKPAPELSRDFFMNMRDIQNSMDDFSDLYDLVGKWVMEVTTFGDEPLSSTVLAFTTIGALGLLLFIQFLPMRLIILIAGNAAILGSNPMLHRYVMTTYLPPEGIQRIRAKIDEFVRVDYIPPPPARQVVFSVEIFEWRRLLPPTTANHLPDWSTSQFSSFPPLSTNSTDRLATVSPPPGYSFGQDDWAVDMNKENWATERQASDDKKGFWVVEQDELGTEGEGWVVYEANGWKVRRLARKVARVLN
jgi:Integral peroxisomal membrane peroxin